MKVFHIINIANMELEGTIAIVMPAMSGVSKATGNKWMSQEYLIHYYWFPNQTQASSVMMRVFGEEKIKRFNLQPNDEVKVRFHAEAHESNGRWYNDLRIDGVTFVGASAGKNNTPAADATGTVAQPSAEQAHEQPAAEMTQEQREAMEKLKNLGEQASTGDANGSEDDMPF